METPARNTRPHNRRALTLEAATGLFYRDGYAHVGMGDIAAATNVGASAIYRHFPGKADILIAAIRSELAHFTAALNEVTLAVEPRPRLHATIRALVECAIDHRELGVLWQREARNLDDGAQRELREEMRDVTGALAALIAAVREDLDGWGADVLAWCAMGALVSLGFHSLSLPRGPFVELLAAMVDTIVELPIAARSEEDPRDAVPRTGSRRDLLMLEAIELFAERGFAAAGVDDIGDAAGIAGPSVYSHFPSKQDILVAAIRHGSELLRADAARELAAPGSDSEKLAGLVRSYVRFANRDRFLIRILLSEMNQLPADERELARRDQRRYIDSWVDLLRESIPSPTEARIRVQAFLLIVNDVVQTPHLRTRPEFEATLVSLGTALLQG